MKIKESRIIETSKGKVQGKTYVFDDGNSASAYLGIPYAKPPIGELRFKKPISADKWTGVKDCRRFKPSFPYVSVVPPETIEFSEDALYLNVFVPESNDSKALNNLPVFFYIHGGAFLLGGSSQMGDEGICKYLCSKAVIVVTINYRFGILGFLTLENEDFKGNYGLWDMAMALKWTKQNISAFGGDSNNITVGGQSAGGMAAEMLTLSPHTWHLFDKLITFAGTANSELMNWDGTLSRKVIIEYAKYLGAEVNGKSASEINRQVGEFYKQVDAMKLGLSLMPKSDFNFYPKYVFPVGPVYDGDFFPKSFDELRKDAPKKCVVNGVTKYEGLFSCIKSKPDMTYEEVVTSLLHSLRPHLSSEIIQKCVEDAIGTWKGDESYERIVNCVKAVSDFLLNDPALEMANIRTKHGDDVYNFVFSYYRKGTLGMLGSIVAFEGATHCMELPYIFGISLLGDFQVVDEDEEIMDRFLTYLTTFMKTGCPNNDKYAEKWEKFKLDGRNKYFLFGQCEFGTREGFVYGEQSGYWTKFFREYPKKCHV